MKKYLLLFIFLLAVISCKNNVTNPVNQNNQNNQNNNIIGPVINYEVYCYLYDTTANKWKEKPISIAYVKADISKSYSKYFLFGECFGKNWGKGGFEEKLGCTLDILWYEGSEYTNEDIYSYDSLGYLYSYIDTFNTGYVKKEIYTYLNGKLKFKETYSNELKFDSAFYEYDNTGYVRKIKWINKTKNSSGYHEYTHDGNGYITQILHSSYLTPETELYSYNSQGLIDKEEYFIEGKLSYSETYTYNSSGQLKESNFDSKYLKSKVKYDYNNNAFPSEEIDYRWDFNKNNFYPTLKKVYKY